MINKLIYTFHQNITKEFYKNIDFDKKLKRYIESYRISIHNSTKLGYGCEIYCDKISEQFFSDLDIKINIIDVGINGLFDNVKAYVYTKRKDDFILIDGDLFLMKRLPKLDGDIIVEKYESIYHMVYKNPVNHLNTTNVSKVVPEWKGNFNNHTVNTGLLYIKNKEIRDIYTKRCFELEKYIMDGNYDNRLNYHATCAQYLLSEIINYYNLKCIDFESNSEPNTYYHLPGSQKLKNLDITKYKLKQKEII